MIDLLLGQQCAETDAGNDIDVVRAGFRDDVTVFIHEGSTTAVGIYSGLAAIVRPFKTYRRSNVELFQQMLNECTSRLLPTVHGVNPNAAVAGLCFKIPTLNIFNKVTGK